MTTFTHRRYFQRYRLSVAQYGEILVAQAFRGRMMGDTQKCYDIRVREADFVDALRDISTDDQFLSLPGANQDVRIQVRSKLSKTASGKASVVHCSESDLVGMTHLAVLLVDPGSRVVDGDPQREGDIIAAWLMTREAAAHLRHKERKTQYIRVAQLRQNPAPHGVADIKGMISEVAGQPLEL